MNHTAPDMGNCIEACTRCHQTCLQMALTHCLRLGGKHVEPAHFTLMMNCAEICQASANLQLSGSDYASKLCGLCAEICTDCADSCEAVGDMDDCVAACRHCAETCASMAAG